MLLMHSESAEQPYMCTVGLQFVTYFRVALTGGGGAAAVQVIEDVSMQAEGADDYERKLTQLRREEELIHEEAREAAAVLRADMPTLRTGEVRCQRTLMPWVGCSILLSLPAARSAESAPAAHAPCGPVRAQTAQQTTAAAAAAAVVREATAAAMAAHPQLEGASEEERIHKLAAAKEERMRKVIRWAQRSLQRGARATTLSHSTRPTALLHSTRAKSEGRCEGSASCHLHVSQVLCCQVADRSIFCHLADSPGVSMLLPDWFAMSFWHF